MIKKILYTVCAIMMIFTLQISHNYEKQTITVCQMEWQSDYTFKIDSMKNIIRKSKLIDYIPIDMVEDEVDISDFFATEARFKSDLVVGLLTFIIGIILGILFAFIKKFGMYSCILCLIIYNIILQFGKRFNFDFMYTPISLIMNIIMSIIGCLLIYNIFFINKIYTKYFVK